MPVSAAVASVGLLNWTWNQIGANPRSNCGLRRYHAAFDVGRGLFGPGCMNSTWVWFL